MNNGIEDNSKIRLDSIRKSFHVDGRSELVLDSVSLTVAPSEFVSIIGPSGCGKSTLLNIIAGLAQPDLGIILLDGDTSHRRLGRVGYMQQKDLLLPWRTILENAMLGLELQGMSRRLARVRAEDLTEIFGLKGFENQYPFALSGGMRQRAAFLRTMLLDQEIVLLDEPFGALDALTRVQMQEWLLDLWRSLGKTIIMITHDVDEALLLSDRVYVFTSRPGMVKMVIDVNVTRPKNYYSTTEVAYYRLRAELLSVLRDESPQVEVSPWP
jgi:ABC-type nitrate/sulfonate/bicarbonate transport system ATPase subunit